MKILLFPGAFQYVRNYPYEGVDIWLKADPLDTSYDADCYIGHSAGASFILANHPIKESKFIFINPIVKKKHLMLFFWDWLRFFIFEGVWMIKREKVIPVRNWLYGLRQVLKLLRIDVLTFIREVPKDNLIVIRGRGDHYFCDEESAETLKENHLTLIEVDAGHDWDEEIARAVRCVLEEFESYKINS